MADNRRTAEEPVATHVRTESANPLVRRRVLEAGDRESVLLPPRDAA